MIGRVGSGEAGELVGVCHPVEFAAVNNGAAYGCVVSVQVFGRGVGDDVSAPFDRPAVNGSGKGVVYDERYAVRVRCLCEALDIKDDEGGVSDRKAFSSSSSLQSGSTKVNSMPILRIVTLKRLKVPP